MIKLPPRRLGYYRQSGNSNKRLVKLFQECQTYWYRDPEEWRSRKFIKELREIEKQARKEVSQMLNQKKLRTPDDFYRAAWFFHHGNTIRSHALAVTLAAVSYHLGEPWGKSFYATAIDRFLISVGHCQYFGTQLDKEQGKWVIAPCNKKVTDQERKEYLGESLEGIKRGIEKLNQTGRGK